METTFPKVFSLAKFTFRLLLLLFSLCVLSFSTSFWFPALLRFSRGFPINFLLIARRITKHGSLKLVDAVTCKGKRKLTGFDSPAKCCSFFFRFFLLLWGKKKATNIVVCVCSVLSYLLCAVLWRLAKKCCPVLAFLFRVAAVWVKIGGHVLYNNIGFAFFFLLIFLPIFIARESF